MRFDRKPPDDDLLLDPPARIEEPDPAWDDPIAEASLLADFQPDSARDGAAVEAPPADDALLFSALGAPPPSDEADDA